jgi:hypothetical protein
VDCLSTTSKTHDGADFSAIVPTKKRVKKPLSRADGTVQKTKAEAQASKEHFDGKTTE